MPGRRLVVVLIATAALAVPACGTDDEPILLIGGTTTTLDGDASELALRTPTEDASTGTAAAGVASPTTGRAAPPTLSGDGVPTSATMWATTTTAPPPPRSTAPASTAPAPTAAPGTAPAAAAPGADDGGRGGVPSGVATEEELAAGEARGIERVNELRGSLGLPGVTRDPELDAFARQWSRHMAETGEFAHSSGPYGENIAFSSDLRLTPGAAADRFHDLWVGSPGHYANLTSDVAVSAGMGLYRTERGWYATYVFDH